MRPRRPEEVAATRAEQARDAVTDLQALEMALGEGVNLPRTLRRELAENSGREVITFMKEVMDGTKKFDVATMAGTVVTVPAAPGIRVRAAERLGHWMGFDLTMIDDSDRLIPNVIVLPELQDEDPDCEYVDEEIEMDSVAETPSMSEEIAALQLPKEPATVDPVALQAVLAKRKKT